MFAHWASQPSAPSKARAEDAIVELGHCASHVCVLRQLPGGQEAAAAQLGRDWTACVCKNDSMLDGLRKWQRPDKQSPHLPASYCSQGRPSRAHLQIETRTMFELRFKSPRLEFACLPAPAAHVTADGDPTARTAARAPPHACPLSSATAALSPGQYAQLEGLLTCCTYCAHTVAHSGHFTLFIISVHASRSAAHLH